MTARRRKGAATERDMMTVFHDCILWREIERGKGKMLRVKREGSETEGRTGSGQDEKGGRRSRERVQEGGRSGRLAYAEFKGRRLIETAVDKS